MRHPREGKSDGFTLVEVLASLALAGAILPAAMAALGLAMALGDAARHRTEAAMLARSALAEMVASGEWQEGRTEGDFGEQWPAYSWRAEVSDWEEPGLQEVALTVQWTSRGAERAVTMMTLAYSGTE